MRTALIAVNLAGILLLTGCSSLEAYSCEESVAGCDDAGSRLSPEQKLQQLIDFCRDYPSRPVCKKNNLD